jgi:hypothetical protein
MIPRTPFLLAGFLSAVTAPGLRAAGPADTEFFEQKIRPVLVERCFECHSTDSKSLKGNLLLDSREGLIKGGDTGPALDEADPKKSLLLSAIHYADPETAMPPKKAGGKLSPQHLADLTAWIHAGAPWPAGGPAKKTSKKFDLAARKQEHWCWSAPKPHTPPTVRDAGWVKAPSDRFLLAKLEAAGLKPAPPADRATLLRRVSFDLTGLPPSPEEWEAFLKDPSPEAYARTVDRLLQSPAFGERWARHWMDLVRYAESRGHEFDPIIPNAWQYRDYLVRAFNADVPYDAFVKEHIAGDLMQPRLLPGTASNESILGTGFWFLGEEVHSPVDIRQDEVDRLDNRLDVMTKTFLGVTVACARCHDHKFDAISQKDYYSLMGYLVSSSQRLARFETMETERKLSAELAQLRSQAGPELLRALAQAVRPGLERLPETLQNARRKALSSQAAPADPAAPAASTADPLAEAWLKELNTAKATDSHPLHAFAKAWLAVNVRPVAPPQPAPVPVAQPGAGSSQPAKPPLLIADYTKPGATPFLQDGFAFGQGPFSAGSVLPGASPGAPLAGVATQTVARRDPAWSNLVAKGDTDPGSLKDFARSGQTLRTPEVTLSSGQLWYLVRGAGKAYAVVNSHLMIQGPLHGRLLMRWKDAGRWEWVGHALPTYAGHRAHIELVPEGTGPFEVAMVVDSETKPPVPDAFLPPVQSALAAADPDPLRALHQLLRETLDGMPSLSPGSAPHQLALADWIARSSPLFCAEGSPAAATLAAATKHWVERHNALCAAVPKESQVASAMFDGSGANEFLLKRGSPKMPTAEVPRRFLEALAGNVPLAGSAGSGRLQLAGQIASADNPLTSRVIVNRVWHHLFGRGIVPTVDNLGVLGQSPSHPELLDSLAVRFATEQRWSLKALLRELVLSSAYAMSSTPADAHAEEADPENVLLHRMHLKRLEGEAIRDAMLSVSGRLDPIIGGPSVPVHMTAFMDGRGKTASGPLDGNGRRSLYVATRRNFLPPMMLAFDTPIPFNTMGRRNVSNVPAQALVLMNDPFVLQQAELWAKKLPQAASPHERLRLMYAAAFAREPSPEETQDALAFLKEQADSLNCAPGDPRPWADFAHVLFNAKEFIHIN